LLDGPLATLDRSLDGWRGTCRDLLYQNGPFDPQPIPESLLAGGSVG
jgi:hypothetical protein